MHLVKNYKTKNIFFSTMTRSRRRNRATGCNTPATGSQAMGRLVKQNRTIGVEGNTCMCELDNCVHAPMTQEEFKKTYCELHGAYVNAFDSMTKTGDMTKEVVDGVINLYYRAIDNHFMKYYGRHFDGVFTEL